MIRQQLFCFVSINLNDPRIVCNSYQFTMLLIKLIDDDVLQNGFMNYSIMVNHINTAIIHGYINITVSSFANIIDEVMRKSIPFCEICKAISIILAQTFPCTD